MANSEVKARRVFWPWIVILAAQIFAFGLAGAFVGGMGGRSNSDPIRLIWVCGFQGLGILIWWVAFRAA
jgi:hypothetical protein